MVKHSAIQTDDVACRVLGVGCIAAAESSKPWIVANSIYTGNGIRT